MSNEQSADREVLFQPLQIRAMHLRNRIVMSPMTRGFCPGGVPTDAWRPITGGAPKAVPV